MREESARMVTLEIQLQLLSDVESKRDYFENEKRINSHFEIVVCDLMRIPHRALRSKSRKREIVLARQICMWYMKTKTTMTLAAIGLEMGGKDHATVLHSCRTIQNYLDTDPEYSRIINEFKKQVNYDED